MNLKQKLERLNLPSLAAPAPEPAEAKLTTLASLRAQLAALTASRTRVRVADGELPARPAHRPATNTAASLDELAGLRAQLEAVRAQSAPGAGPNARVVAPESRWGSLAVATPPGERVETAHGVFYRFSALHGEDHRHGAAELARARRVCASEIAVLALDPTLAQVDFARALYIDTETTGLSGGAGTLPFLIGMAWFEGERLRVEQLLLARPGLEAPLFARLSERLCEASAIVSYNGKSFDWPLLRTRFVLNRMAVPALPAHLDLLHCARRVYRARLGSVRLVHVEQELLGFERVDDIAGELIPQTYLGFLRGLVPGAALTAIVEHNRSDLLALPALLGELARRFGGEHTTQDVRDQLGFARVAARGAAAERALAFAAGVVERDLRGELAASALYLAAELKLRRGALEDAVEAFERSLELSASAADAARAHLALAKLHEHKTKQHERALHHAAQTAACEGETASARRVERLLGRLRRAGAQPR